MARISETIVVFSQETGNVVPFSQVEIKVRNDDGSSGAYADIYASEQGGSPIQQPATTNSRGSLTFYTNETSINAEYDDGSTLVTMPIDLGGGSGEVDTTANYDWTGEHDFLSIKSGGKRVLNTDDIIDTSDFVTVSSGQNISGAKNFTGELQKNGVDVLAKGDYGLGSSALTYLSIDLNEVIETGFYYIGGPSTNKPHGDGGTLLVHAAVSGNLTQTFTNIISGVVSVRYLYGSNWSQWRTISLTEKNETITGQKNFTGGLLKNNTDVLSLGDLTPGSSASLVLAESSIEQFTLNQQAGLYDDFGVAEGAIAAGWINAVSAQMNYLISQGANIEKIKSSAIEVSGAGYALNQNPTWQDSLDGWSFANGLTVDIQDSVGVVVANKRIQLTTLSNNEPYFSEKVPVSELNTYTVSVWVYSTSSATQYLAVRFYDSSGATISGSGGGATGWGGLGAYNYFGIVNNSAPATWVKHEIKFGLNGDATIPSGATHCAIGGLAFHSGSTSGKLYLQNYRIEKAMGSVHIENGSINADHLVLSGDGSITFATVGADQAGSASTAETNAKAYAFPASSAGALASRNTVGPTHIDANAVTTPKIATDAITTDKIEASQALLDKIVASYIFGENARFVGKVYAENLEGDTSEYGEVALGAQSIPYNSWTWICECNIGPSESLDRELTIEPFIVNEGDGCEFEVQVFNYPVAAGATTVIATYDIPPGVATGAATGQIQTGRFTLKVSKGDINNTYAVRAKNNVQGRSPVTSGKAIYKTRALRADLNVYAL